MIRRQHFERILEAVRRAGVGADLEALLRPTSGGRPRRLKADVMIAALIATAEDGRRLTFVNVHATLTTHLARSAQETLGVRWKSSTEAAPCTISLRQVRYIFEALERRLAYAETSVPEVSSGEREIRKEVFERIRDRILEASLPTGVTRPTALALDVTAVESWSKGKRRPKVDRDGSDAGPEPCEDDGLGTEEVVRDRQSADPDAAAGYRTETHDNKSSMFFGYDVHALVGVLPVGADPDDGPKLLHSVSLTPASTDVVEPSLAQVDRLIKKGYTIRDLLVDRAYSYKRPERWANELFARDINQVIDLHPQDRGMRDYDGVLAGDGGIFCPAMPRHLWEIARPSKFTAGKLRKDATLAERQRHARLEAEIEEFQRLIAERQTWAFKRLVGAPENARDQGKQRMLCPAQAGKRKCANCPMSAKFEDVPVVKNPPAKATAPTACHQVSVTIEGDVLAKLRQEHPWGTPEWTASQSRRTQVEGFFGNLKNSSTGNIKRGWCRVRGLVKTSLMFVCAAAATNIRLLRVWAKRVGYSGELLCEPDDADYGFEELDGAGAIRVHGPPGLAA